MNRRDWVALGILLVLIPIPFISTNFLIKFAEKFFNTLPNQKITIPQMLPTFRLRQLVSARLIILLFILSLGIAYFLLNINLSRLSWLPIISTMLLTQSVFGKLGWEVQTWGGGSVMEMINEWWFRIIYSIGVILLFLTMVR